MSMVSHADVIGIVLFLILGAVSYYFYARISQLERKVGLMENILFDLKLTTEQAMNLLTEPEDGAHPIQQETHKSVSWNTPFSQSVSQEEVIPASLDAADTKELSVMTSSRTRTAPQTLQVDRSEEQTIVESTQQSSSAPVTPNYEAMTYKELVQLAKQRGIGGLRNASKAQVIDALRNDGVTQKEPTKSLDISSWMQDATPLQDREQSGELQSASDSGFGGTLLSSSDIDVSEVDASLVGNE